MRLEQHRNGSIDEYTEIIYDHSLQELPYGADPDDVEESEPSFPPGVSGAFCKHAVPSRV